MKVKYVTFTGVDNWTDLDELERIQEKYPYAEFGVLASYHYGDNGPRFPEPQDNARTAGSINAEGRLAADNRADAPA